MEVEEDLGDSKAKEIMNGIENDLIDTDEEAEGKEVGTENSNNSVSVRTETTKQNGNNDTQTEIDLQIDELNLSSGNERTKNIETAQNTKISDTTTKKKVTFQTESQVDHSRRNEGTMDTTDEFTNHSQLHSTVDKIPVPGGTGHLRRPIKKLSVIAKSKENIIRHRGQKMVMDFTLYETPIKIEFNIARDTEEFNARAELLQLLHKMKQRDKKLRVKSSIPGTNGWDELDNIPEDDNFIDQFQAKEFTYRTCTGR